MESMDNKRERSALYPMMTVEECFETIKIIDGIGGKVFSVNAIADALGVSEKTNSFRAKISTLKQYGLLQGVQNTYRLTENANRYLYPIEDKQRKDSMVDAFLCVALYKKLVEKYENQALPPQERLANLLLNKEYGLTKNTKDTAAELFITSLQQLGLLVNGVLMLKPETVTLKQSIEEAEVSGDVVGEDKTFIEEKKIDADKYYNFEIPTLSGDVAKIIIPQNVTLKDLDFIQMYIENMLPVFLNNLRTGE